MEYIAFCTTKRNRCLHEETKSLPAQKNEFAPGNQIRDLTKKINLTMHRKTTWGSSLGISLTYGTKKRIGALSTRRAKI